MGDLAYSVIGTGVFVWLIAAGFDQCSRREGFSGQEYWREARHLVSHSGSSSSSGSSAKRQTIAVPSVPSARRVERPAGGDSDRLIPAIGREFDVPAGALYGIWKVESGGLAGGWGQGRGWLFAAALSQPGSQCYREYAASRCEGWWGSLQAICGQTRNGVRICDPNEVRTSYAFAMGPMQHLPSLFAPRGADGSYRLGDHVVDYDRDGVADPHDLGDALASTAKVIRKYFEEEGSWQRAVNRYYGSQTEGYYEKVYNYWSEWCGTHDCRQGGSVNYASK